MSRKEKIMGMINGLNDDVTYDRVIYHLSLMREVEVSLEQADRGEVIDHDEVMAQSEVEDANGQARLVAARTKAPAKHRANNRARRPSNGKGVRPSAKARSRKTQKVS